jgi:lysophospholipase
MRLDTQVIKTSDRTELFVRSYSPEHTNTHRTLYWVHGIGEHGGRHAHIAELVTGHGWRLILADLRGHGRSTGTPTHVMSFDEYVSDIRTVWQQLDLDTDSTALLGHSMGGLIALRAVQTGSVVPAALVLSSPLLGLKLYVNPVTVFLGRILVRLVPTARFSNGIDASNMTRDVDFAMLRRSDDLINKTVTAGWFFAMKSALSAAHRDAEKVSLPVLALQGGLDRTTDPGAMADWWERISSKDKTLIILDDHLHELFFEADWRETAQQMFEWLNQKLSESRGEVSAKLIDAKERP